MANTEEENSLWEFHSQKFILNVGCDCPLLWVGVGPPRAGPHPNLLADVLPSEDLPAGPALKTPQVPLLFQGQQGLPVLDVSSATGTIWKKKAEASSHSAFLLFSASAQASPEAQCAAVAHSADIYVRPVSSRCLPCPRPFPAVSQAPSSHGMGTSWTAEGPSSVYFLRGYLNTPWAPAGPGDI